MVLFMEYDEDVVLLVLSLPMMSMMRMPMIPERDSKEPQQQQTLSARVAAEGSPDRDHADKRVIMMIIRV